MAFHNNASLDAAFDTTYGAADPATVSPAVGDSYTAPCILKRDVEINDDSNGIVLRVTTLEFRKADLADPSAALLRGTLVVVGSKTHYIEELVQETTYTVTYYCTK